MGIKNLTYLIIFMTLFSRSIIAMDGFQENQQTCESLSIEIPYIEMTPINNQNSNIGTIIQKLKNNNKFKSLAKLIQNNSNGLKVALTVTAVLLLHFYYAEVSSITYAAQIGAGKTILEYGLSKKINLIPLLIMFAAVSEGIFLTTEATDVSTGLATVFNISFIYGLLKFLNDNLNRIEDDVEVD